MADGGAGSPFLRPLLRRCHSWKVPVTVWNKLYRAELIDKLRFKEGRIVEDVLYMYDLSLEVKKQRMSLLQLPDYLYYYRIR